MGGGEGGQGSGRLVPVTCGVESVTSSVSMSAVLRSWRRYAVSVEVSEDEAKSNFPHEKKNEWMCCALLIYINTERTAIVLILFPF